MNLIVAVDRNWGIGYKNKLLASIPEDMKFFRQETSGKVVVMGRKTLESFPGGMPLRNRTNIVLTRNPNYQAKGAVVLHSEEEVLGELEKYPPENVYIIGGESVYRTFLSRCDVAHVTRINHAYEADAYFPDIDGMPEWELTGMSDEKTYFDLEFRFYLYKRRKG